MDNHATTIRYMLGCREDETGKQLVKEACDVYYGENHFHVRLHWLYEFMTDILSDHKTKVCVAPLIKDSITVIVDLYDALNDFFLYEDGCDSDSVLYGRGLLDGSDLATHQMIKDISYVMKLLIQKFGDKFAIRKMISRGDDHEGNHPSRSIRSY
ncbi:hypothetical protein DER45DRAFT_604267 [Fusarium avenaceum]|nr:hypothetical protein DER45DRAFT_604267 [Fusarium avenaceum]